MKTLPPRLPRSAFLAVTLLCNSRCIHCDIWKNKGLDYLPLDIYRRLPASLTMIDITGGEPFLRPDIPELVSVLRQTCPRARILITTHGFMNSKIGDQIEAILRADPSIAVRVSLDGLGEVHDEIRGIPGGYEKVEATLRRLRQAKVKDLGIIFTLMKRNQHQLREIYHHAKRHRLALTLNAVHDSPVYFGEGKQALNADPKEVEKDFRYVIRGQLKSINPKNWAKAWFNDHLHRYMATHERPFPCGSGEDFFYMDSAANIFMCQYKNWPIGNLSEHPFEEIWDSKAKAGFLPMAHECQGCWAVCTAKDAMRRRKWKILAGLPGLFKK